MPVQESIASAIHWFEIPASDFARAIRFYEMVFGITLRHESAWPDLAIFPFDRPGITGAIANLPNLKPNSDGVIIYLNCNGKFDAVLDRVEAAGGAIVEKKAQLPNIGWVAQIQDTEGNRIGLHAAA